MSDMKPAFHSSGGRRSKLLFVLIATAWFVLAAICSVWWGVPFWNGSMGRVLVLPAAFLMGPFMLLTLQPPHGASLSNLVTFAVLTAIFGLLSYALIFVSDRGVRIGAAIVAVVLWVGFGLFSTFVLTMISA